jgi:hypothetical protein
MYECMAHCSARALELLQRLGLLPAATDRQRELLNAKDVQQARQLSLRITSCRSMCVQLANGYMQISGTQQC